jgi:hypothetical protein
LNFSLQTQLKSLVNYETSGKAIQVEECDAIFHVGDAIAIGPYPAECLDLMQGTSNLICVSGNHDLYSVNGLPDPQPDWMSEAEI